MRALILLVPLALCGCAAMMEAGRAVVGVVTGGGGVEAAAGAAKLALPGWAGVLIDVALVAGGPLIGIASKKFNDYVGLEEPVSEKPAGLETA